MSLVLRGRERRRGQTLIALAVALGTLMTVGALVIDLGTLQRQHLEAQHVCDAAALAGMAHMYATKDPDAARARALEICARNGFGEDSDDIVNIVARGFNHVAWPDEDPTQLDRTDSDRYQVIITHEPHHSLAALVMPGKRHLQEEAVAAGLVSAPADVELGARLLFPDEANLAQIGPQGQYSFGDCYGVTHLDNGAPNPLYSEDGYLYDILLPLDLQVSSGSTLARVEIFDPDTINQGNHVAKNPFKIKDVNGNPDEPAHGAIDEIRAPPPNGNIATSPAEFPARSTQTVYDLLDGQGDTIASATYGPHQNTPFYYVTEDPHVSIPHAALHADPAQAQIATDLKWITPEGFEFDTASYTGPFSVRVKTVSGSSENGFSMRISAHRPDGVGYDKTKYGMSQTAALVMYARGKLPINFHDSSVDRIPIAAVPAEANDLMVSNFDTETSAKNAEFRVISYDQTSGQGFYPILFPVPENVNTAEIMEDLDGNKYVIEVSGNLSADSEFASTSLHIPNPVIVPRTDGAGNLLFSKDGRIEIVDKAGRKFEGGTIDVSYAAGQNDTSVWETSYTGKITPDTIRIVLIR